MGRFCSFQQAKWHKKEKFIIILSDFFEKKTLNKYLKLEICVVCRKCIAFK